MTVHLFVYCATVVKKRNKSTLILFFVHSFVFTNQYRLFSDTDTVMNYAENNVCCVNQYQIPGALKLPLEATTHFVFFPIKVRKNSNFFFFISWFCNLSQSSSETPEICIPSILCLPYFLTMHFSYFPRYLSKMCVHWQSLFILTKKQKILIWHHT